jgi:hypothetical protein
MRSGETATLRAVLSPILGGSFVAFGLLAAGCHETTEPDLTGDDSAALVSTNGLSMINGLSMTNGLSMLNGLSMTNGLASGTGLSSATGLMTTAEGRNTVAYIVKCALPSGRSLVKQDQHGNRYTFPGAIGLAPGWETAGATQQDRYWVSSCLMAHINTTGQHIPIWLDASAPAIGWGRNSAYPVQEGTFVGDLFASPPTARYCGGRGYGSNVVAGRIGDTGQSGEPYQVMIASNGSTSCEASCARDATGDGYTACLAAGISGNPITVWRQFITSPNISFEGNTGNFMLASGSQPTTMSVATDRSIHGTRSLLSTVNATSAGNANLYLDNPSGVVPGKSFTVFVDVPQGSNWTSVNAFVQDGPGKSYRWTQRGYKREQVIAGEWNSIVVPVPSDFSASGSRVGIDLQISGPGTIKLYSDAVFLAN